MLANTAHPPAGRPPRLLNLQPDPALPRPAAPPLITPLISGDLLRIAHRLAELTRLVFPEKPEWLEKRLDWDEATLAGDIEAFLGNVTRHRFPIMDEIFDDILEDSAWRLWQLPVFLQGFSTWDSGEWEYYKEPVPLLMKLACWRYLGEGGREQFAADYPHYRLPAAFELHGLDKRLEEMELPAHLAALPDLVRMALEETGNRWLDYSNEYMAECGCYPSWEDDYEDLLAEWRQAEPVIERINGLMDRVVAKMPGSLDTIFDALLAAHEQRLVSAPDTVVTPEPPLLEHL